MTTWREYGNVLAAVLAFVGIVIERFIVWISRQGDE